VGSFEVKSNAVVGSADILWSVVGRRQRATVALAPQRSSDQSDEAATSHKSRQKCLIPIDCYFALRLATFT
jgi:hypothetical protein